jgi:hypothetical protein
MLALGRKTDFYGSQLLIQKSPTIVTGAIVTSAITSAITAAITSAITAAVAAAVTAAITAAATARPRRRHPDLTATAAAITAAIVTAAMVAAAITAAIIAAAIVAAAITAGVGRIGSSSKCESRCEHDSYPAKSQHHDASPSMFIWR